MQVVAVNTSSKPQALSASVRGWLKAHHLALLTALTLIAFIFILWLPTGWNVSAISDNWVFFNLFDNGSSPLSFDAMRPFGYVLEWLQHALTPNSWFGSNLVIAALMFLKGLALYALVRELLPKQPAIAFGAAMLYTVCFADLGVFWPVAVNVHGATLGARLAAWLLLRQWRKPAALNLVFMAISQIFALSYEGVFAVIFAAPVLLLFPARGINRRVLRLALIWYAAPVVIVTRYVIVASQSTTVSYQSQQAAVALQGDVFAVFSSSVFRIYKRLLGVVWYDQKSILLDYRTYWLLAAGMGALAAHGIHYHLRASSERLSWRIALEPI